MKTLTPEETKKYIDRILKAYLERSTKKINNVYKELDEVNLINVYYILKSLKILGEYTMPSRTMFTQKECKELQELLKPFTTSSSNIAFGIFYSLQKRVSDSHGLNLIRKLLNNLYIINNSKFGDTSGSGDIHEFANYARTKLVSLLKEKSNAKDLL